MYKSVFIADHIVCLDQVKSLIFLATYNSVISLEIVGLNVLFNYKSLN